MEKSGAILSFPGRRHKRGAPSRSPAGPAPLSPRPSPARRSCLGGRSSCKYRVSLRLGRCPGPGRGVGDGRQAQRQDQESQALGGALRRADGPARRGLHPERLLRSQARPLGHPGLHRPRRDAGGPADHPARGRGEDRPGPQGHPPRGGGGEVPLRPGARGRSHERRGGPHPPHRPGRGEAPHRPQPQRPGGHRPAPLAAGGDRPHPGRPPGAAPGPPRPGRAGSGLGDAGLHPPPAGPARHLRPPPAGLQPDAPPGRRAAGGGAGAGERAALGGGGARRHRPPHRPADGGPQAGLRRDRWE